MHQSFVQPHWPWQGEEVIHFCITVRICMYNSTLTINTRRRDDVSLLLVSQFDPEIGLLCVRGVFHVLPVSTWDCSGCLTFLSLRTCEQAYGYA